MNSIQIDQYIKLCLQGDTNAFRHLLSEYQQMVYTLAFRILCNETDAEDVTQDVFIKVWQNIGKYNNTYKFSTWLYKITANLCYDRFRSVKNKEQVGLSGLTINSDTDILGSIHNKELKALILQTTERLTPKQKQVFILSDIEELDIKEISIITQMSPSQIKSNLYLARKYIKSKLKPYE